MDVQLGVDPAGGLGPPPEMMQVQDHAAVAAQWLRDADRIHREGPREYSSVEEMARMTTLASRELRAIPGVRNFGSHIGRAEVADEVVGPNFTELWISVDPQGDHAAILAKVQDVVDGHRA